MPYDICLFDLDGTLTDPKIGITKSFQHALFSFGINEELSDLVRFIGPPLRESFRVTFGFSDSDVELAVAVFREYFATTGIFENIVYSGIPELLQKLKDDGRILAVATSKATFYSDQILKHFELYDYFDFISGDEMDGSLTKNGKTEIIRIALDNLDPGRKKSAIMIGDRKHDVLAARENGIDCIGDTWGYGSRDELETSGAKRIVDTTDELFRIITETEERDIEY